MKEQESRNIGQEHYIIGFRLRRPPKDVKTVTVTIGGYHYKRIAEFASRKGLTMRQAIEDFLVMGWLFDERQKRISARYAPEPPENAENQPNLSDIELV